MSDQENIGKILIYQTERGDTKIDTFFEDGTVWMTQKNIAQLYQTTSQNITLHIKNILTDRELDESTCKEYLQVQNEGGREIARRVKCYNLDMILAIGYRVRSSIGTHFRQWTTTVLTEFMRKGFVMNDERLKNPKAYGEDYFDELLERIRDIRASEKRVYESVKKIFALSVDYDSKSEQADKFFKTAQNKLEFASTGHTAPEIIAERADATKDNMGLNTFKGAKVRKGDVTVAKNYMTHDEISMLNRIVTMYLDYAELMAENHRAMHMSDWEDKLGEFLRFNGREVLQGFGKVQRAVADKLALEQYERFNAQRRAVECGDVEGLASSAKQIASQKK